MNKKRMESLSRQTERNYKDTLFRMIFRQPEELLSLYNAIHGTDYKDTSLLQVVTLENAIYMNVKNDLACIVDCRMDLYEHQASVNPNMPLRDLFYVSAEYRGMVEMHSIYSHKKAILPPPTFIVLYNGTDQQPERRLMKLSDLYVPRVEEPNLELKVWQLNIGEGYNQQLKEKCPTLLQYAQYVTRVQKYAKEIPFEKAVELAIDECIKEGILADFLRKNRTEAIEVCIFEYDEELFRKAERELGREEGREEGLTEGRKESILLLLEEMGDLSENLRNQILLENDTEQIRRWLKNVAKCTSIDEFLAQM